MSPSDLSQRIDEYVRTRLRREVADGPRGTASRLAKALNISAAHLSNMLAPNPSRNPGETVTRAAAAHWGIDMATLEALAIGENPPARLRLVVGNDVRSRALRAMLELYPDDPTVEAYVSEAALQERTKALEGWSPRELLAVFEDDFRGWKRAHDSGEESSSVQALFGEGAQVREDASDGRPPLAKRRNKP